MCVCGKYDKELSKEWSVNMDPDHTAQNVQYVLDSIIYVCVGRPV